MILGDTHRAPGRRNPAPLSICCYAQALNLENYLYLAMVSFGLTTVATYAGLFMILAGLAIVITGVFITIKSFPK